MEAAYTYMDVGTMSAFVIVRNRGFLTISSKDAYKLALYKDIANGVIDKTWLPKVSAASYADCNEVRAIVRNNALLPPWIDTFNVFGVEVLQKYSENVVQRDILIELFWQLNQYFRRSL